MVALIGPSIDVASDVDLLATLVGAAPAARLVERFGSLSRLARAGVAELASVPGLNVALACRLRAALALATRLGQRPYQRGDPVHGPADVHARVGPRLRALEREVFVVLALDTKHRVLAEWRLAEGGVCSLQVFPRDLFAPVLREAAAAMICVHNHPSGDASPSGQDVLVTERLRAAGELVGVAVVDHIIVGDGAYYSFAEGRCSEGFSGLAGSTD